jgi:hypothetical protein
LETPKDIGTAPIAASAQDLAVCLWGPNIHHPGALAIRVLSIQQLNGRGYTASSHVAGGFVTSSNKLK